MSVIKDRLDTIFHAMLASGSLIPKTNLSMQEEASLIATDFILVAEQLDALGKLPKADPLYVGGS